MYPDQLLKHAELLQYCIDGTEDVHQRRLEPIPYGNNNEILRWILKVQGNILIPHLNEENLTEIIVQVKSLNLRQPVNSAITDMLGEAGAKVKVSVEHHEHHHHHHDRKDPYHSGGSQKHWEKFTDVQPYNDKQDVKFKAR